MPASAFHDARVRLVRVTEGEEALAVEEHELLRHVGQAGVGDSLDDKGGFRESVSVLFDDGCRLDCLPEELELCTDVGEPVTVVREGTEDRTSFVQSCIAHVGFPDTLAGLAGVIAGDDTEMEKLLWPHEAGGGGWTAPRWLTQGDIIFFYHTKRALQRVTRLIKASADPDNEEWRAAADPDAALGVLADQMEIARRYAGTIFACALVTGPASYWRSDDADRDERRYWRSNIYAQISRPHVFARPLRDEAFRGSITISPGGAITPVHGPAFESLKALLAAKNRLPAFLADARPGGVSFRDVNGTNWIDISCSPQARFIDESQLRAYLLDHLLDAIKDPRTVVHEECRCGLDRKHPSVADYMVHVHGRWVAVEAKLNVGAERDLPGQVSKYVGVDEFVPTRGPRTGELVAGPVASTCLAADADGLYLLDASGYVDCGPERPLLRREAITKATIAALRERLRQASTL